MLKLSAKILVLLSTYSLLIEHSNGATMDCQYHTGQWTDGENWYYCYVQNNDIYDGSRVQIDSVKGRHAGSKTNDDVMGLDFIPLPTITYFPTNIPKVFKNIQGIHMYPSNLQELKQNDMKQFPKLKYLCLRDNNVRVIEKDTFKFNPDLKTIWLMNNQLTHIDPNVFDHLHNLNVLDLTGNRCKTSFSKSFGHSNVMSVISRINNGECKTIENNLEDCLSSQCASELSDKYMLIINQQASSFGRILSEMSSKIQNLTESLNELREKYEDLERKQNLIDIRTTKENLY